MAVTPPPTKQFEIAAKVFGENIAKAAADALREEHELAMTAAKLDTPVEFGILRASGTVFPTEVSPGRLVSRGGFGGGASEYAVYVHEDLTAKHPRGGHAKWYETALLNAARGMESRLAAGIRRRMR